MITQFLIDRKIRSVSTIKFNPEHTLVQESGSVYGEICHHKWFVQTETGSILEIEPVGSSVYPDDNPIRGKSVYEIIRDMQPNTYVQAIIDVEEQRAIVMKVPQNWDHYEYEVARIRGILQE